MKRVSLRQFIAGSLSLSLGHCRGLRLARAFVFRRADDSGRLLEEGVGRHADIACQQRPPRRAGHHAPEADTTPVEPRGE